jgi:hypothetical protein
MLVRATADVSLDGGTRDMHAFHVHVGARWWSPSITPDALGRTCVDLREAAKRWDALEDGSVLRLTWPRSRR